MKEYQQSQLCLIAIVFRHLQRLMVSVYGHVQIRVNGSKWLVAPKFCPQSMRRRLAGQKKSRRKQPHEVTGEQGSRMSKHGVEMHCSHCKEAGHNTAGCSLKKLGLKRKAAAPQADDAEEKVLIQVL